MNALRQTRRSRVIGAVVAASLVSAAAPAGAVSITKTFVGTLSNPLTAFGAGDGNNPGLVERGNKYVIRTTFDTDDIVSVNAAGRLFQTRDFSSIALGDAPGGTNTFELSIPSEGFGGVLTQTGLGSFRDRPEYGTNGGDPFFQFVLERCDLRGRVSRFRVREQLHPREQRDDTGPCRRHRVRAA